MKKGTSLSTPRRLRPSGLPDRPWTPRERSYLKTRVDAGDTSITIAGKLKRTRQSVIDETNRLHLNNGYEPDPAEKPTTIRICLSCNREFESREYHVCPRCRDTVEFRSPVDNFFVDHPRFSKKGK